VKAGLLGSHVQLFVPVLREIHEGTGTKSCTMLYAAFLAEIWIFYDSKKTQISARKAATYSAV